MPDKIKRNIPDLIYGERYSARIRAISHLGVASEWSEAIDFVARDGEPPEYKEPPELCVDCCLTGHGGDEGGWGAGITPTSRGYRSGSAVQLQDSTVLYVFVIGSTIVEGRAPDVEIFTSVEGSAASSTNVIFENVGGAACNVFWLEGELYLLTGWTTWNGDLIQRTAMWRSPSKLGGDWVKTQDIRTHNRAGLSNYTSNAAAGRPIRAADGSYTILGTAFATRINREAFNIWAMYRTTDSGRTWHLTYHGPGSGGPSAPFAGGLGRYMWENPSRSFARYGNEIWFVTLYNYVSVYGGNSWQWYYSWNNGANWVHIHNQQGRGSLLPAMMEDPPPGFGGIAVWEQHRRMGSGPRLFNHPNPHNLSRIPIPPTDIPGGWANDIGEDSTGFHYYQVGPRWVLMHAGTLMEPIPATPRTESKGIEWISPDGTVFCVSISDRGQMIATNQETGERILVGVGFHDHGGQYASYRHGHFEYAFETHLHDDKYSPLSHNHHSDYASIVHDHDDDYAPIELDLNYLEDVEMNPGAQVGYAIRLQENGKWGPAPDTTPADNEEDYRMFPNAEGRTAGLLAETDGNDRWRFIATPQIPHDMAKLAFANVPPSNPEVGMIFVSKLGFKIDKEGKVIQ